MNKEEIKKYKALNYTLNKEDILRKNKEMYKSNPDLYRERSKKNRENAPPKQAKEYQLKRNYGLSLEDFEGMLLKQDNKCAICSSNLSTRPHIDHSHSTGKVRAILCQSCNVGLGHFKDNEEFLYSAIQYLNKYSDITLPEEL